MLIFYRKIENAKQKSLVSVKRRLYSHPNKPWISLFILTSIKKGTLFKTWKKT